MTRDWEEGLRNSAMFLCLVTPHYLRSPECWEQLALAKRLGKPCRALIQEGTPVPDGFLDGFVDLKCYTFRSKHDLSRIARQLRDELGASRIIDGGVY